MDVLNNCLPLIFTLFWHKTVVVFGYSESLILMEINRCKVALLFNVNRANEEHRQIYTLTESSENVPPLSNEQVKTFDLTPQK